LVRPSTQTSKGRTQINRGGDREVPRRARTAGP